MKRRLAVPALVCAVIAAGHAHAQETVSPRDIWPRATIEARDGDLAAAGKRVTDLLAAGRAYGIKTYPRYASAASGLASESEVQNRELSDWGSMAAAQLDSTSPAVAFQQADSAARHLDWERAVPLALRGFQYSWRNYRASLLGWADLRIVAAIAVMLSALVLSIALFIRYGRSMAHDFRELFGRRLRGGSVTVLAFAMIFLPIFLWLGPLWVLFYWMAIFFVYATAAERSLIVVLLLLTAGIPVVVDATAHRVAGAESPAVVAAVSGDTQAYYPEALGRLEEVIAAVPNDPTLQVLAGNMQAFEGNDEQAERHYRRAIEIRSTYAGARVNLGNLLFLNNDFQAALTEYEIAQRADPKLAIAFYNSSVASGEIYRFDQQARMLEAARKANRAYVERITRNPPQQKIVMYTPPVDEAWEVTRRLSGNEDARALFGNYSRFDPLLSAANQITIAALAALLLALVLLVVRGTSNIARACIKCGRTFCHRCKSSRESSTYCTQCIHIYLKRDGVSLETKRQKLDEVTDHHAGVTRRNKLFATFFPGSAQLLEGRTVKGVIATLLFAFFVAVAILTGRLAPALGPSAEVAQMIVRIVAIAGAAITWALTAVPVYRRRSVA